MKQVDYTKWFYISRHPATHSGDLEGVAAWFEHSSLNTTWIYMERRPSSSWSAWKVWTSIAMLDE